MAALMDHREYFSTLAHYNEWATERLLCAIDALSDAEYRKDCGLFFKSVHGTLNHLLIGEHLLWYARFADGTSPKVDLGAEIEVDRQVVRERLLTLVKRWQPLVARFTLEQFSSTLSYTTTKGVPTTLPFSATLTHVFNHATHHRGQITAALTALGQTCPELDLVYMLQLESKMES